MRLRRTVIALTMTAGLGSAGCGVGAGDSIVGKDQLVIGVARDQPRLGLEKDGRYQGFDVDVATYVAGRLGVDPQHIKFIPVVSSTRERALGPKGKADMVVSSYSITAERKTKVAFAGPYIVAHEDILVRNSDAASVRNVRDLRDRQLCRVGNSVSYRRVTEQLKVAARPVTATSYGDCMNKLMHKSVAAIATDDLILAGLASEQPRSVQIVGAPFSDERYGVGLRRDDIDGCEAVNRAITDMYLSGTAARLLNHWFGDMKLKTITAPQVPQFEGCDQPVSDT